MKKIMVVLSILTCLQNISSYAQTKQKLDTLSSLELELYLINDCCNSKKEFCQITDEFIKRIINKEHLTIGLATRLLERKYENVEFFSQVEAHAFAKQLLDLDISYDNQLRLEIYYQILKKYNTILSEEKKDDLLKNCFKIREEFYHELVKFQEFNRFLANSMVGMGDTVLFNRFNGDVLSDVIFSSLRIGDKPDNMLDRRISEKLLEVQMAAFWDRVTFFSRRKDKKALIELRDSKNYLIQAFKAQPGFVPKFNQTLKNAQLDTIPIVPSPHIKN